MKKVVFSVIVIGTIIISGVIGFSNQDGLADKKGDFGSAILSFNILDK
ncbi:hypothetical protein SAMN04489762_2418 [Terribacillus saccharophilus]|uniref:Phr family secreted Rap phosphatase inhibitor n=1 Tax=Terribacillus saccharophilus TaxID=361277 RepID=A0AAX2EGX3_9BACI|nr:hypothetical protein [Terribacillus saccharophilus]MCM3225763.1 hypothetical protein [Terribacillus saccharophilus]MEC0281535.1 hypothetical protein [Terribacillus saccharophilus]MEC0291679.1 hypothetical protein [Terribacillus saccharophilus]SEN50853.1 hypothetical protein SAMN04489762_2418 [Terribacillus saccharophilus]